MRKTAEAPEINAGSMADIAFLLLIFFLVTTTILQEKGLMLKLPPEQNLEPVKINERNIFKILINSNNQFLVEGEIRKDLNGLRGEIETFVMNNGHNPRLSDNPEEAIVSIKTSRGTDYGQFITALDETKAAYYGIYGRRVGMTGDEFRQLDLRDPMSKRLYQKGKDGIPMNISIAEPEKTKS